MTDTGIKRADPLANAAEDGKEFTGGFGNIRITLTFKDDKVVSGYCEILGEDKSGERFANKAIQLAMGQDVDDLPDISPKQIYAAVGLEGEEALRYAKYASGALGFVTTKVHRVAYDGMLEEVERLADEMDAPMMPEIFRGLGGCAGCSMLKPGGGCKQPGACDNK